MAYCAIYKLKTKEVEFIEQWDDTHIEGIQTDWAGTVNEFFAERCRRLYMDCMSRGWSEWQLYKSEDTPFSWDEVIEKAEKQTEKA